jgi:hypothetical protein
MAKLGILFQTFDLLLISDKNGRWTRNQIFREMKLATRRVAESSNGITSLRRFCGGRSRLNDRSEEKAGEEVRDPIFAAGHAWMGPDLTRGPNICLSKANGFEILPTKRLWWMRLEEGLGTLGAPLPTTRESR